MAEREIFYFKCDIVEAIEESSSHEIDFAKKEVKHKPGRLIPVERSGILMVSMFPQELCLPEGRSPISDWTGAYRQCVVRSLDIADGPVPFARWVETSPVPLERCIEFKTTTTYAPKHLATDISRTVKKYAPLMLPTDEAYKSLRDRIDRSPVEAVLWDRKLEPIRDEQWVKASFVVLDSLLQADDARAVNVRGYTRAQEYVKLMLARADGRPKDVAEYAWSMLQSKFSDGRGDK